MEAKKLLKKHLDIHIPKGEYRSEKQLIQLRYDACIAAINEALTIHSVVKPLNDTRCELGQDYDCSCIDVCRIDRKTKI